VDDQPTGEEHEQRRDPGLGGLSLARRDVHRLDEYDDEQHGQPGRGDQRQVPPLRHVGEQGDEERRERRAQPQQHVQRRQGHVPAVGHEGARIGADGAQGEAEPEAQGCGGHQQHGVRPRIVFDGDAAHQQGHGQRVGQHAGEQHPLQGEAA
jgi:hypothetical protein